MGRGSYFKLLKSIFTEKSICNCYSNRFSWSIQKQKPTQRKLVFWRCTIFRLAKPAFFRCNENFTLGPTTAAEHFLSSPNHTANDMQSTPIEKIFSNRDSIRKAREAFLIQKRQNNWSWWSEHPWRNILIGFLLLCSFIMLFYFTVCLSLIYTVN